MYVCLSPASRMCNKIENPAKCEVCSVIRFLNGKTFSPIEIYRQINDTYGETVMKKHQLGNSGLCLLRAEQVCMMMNVLVSHL